MRRSTTPPRLRLLLALFVLHLIAFSLLRVCFWLLYRHAPPLLSPADTARSFYLGLRFDVRLSIFVLLPFAALGGIPRLDPSRSSRARTGWWVAALALDALLILLYAVDFAHFGWTHERVNATILDNLLSPVISLQTIWESYPLGRALVAYAVLLYADGKLLKTMTTKTLGEARSGGSPALVEPLTAGRRAAPWLAALLLASALAWGRLSRYPLRWSDAFFSGDAFAAALASNPVLYLLDTIDEGRPPYDEAALRAAYPSLAARFGVNAPDTKTLSFVRQVKPGPHALPGHPNIVIVFMESFAALKTGRFGHTPDLDPTPEYDAISRNSVFFTHFFSPRMRTSRAIFCTLFGIPDVNPDRSASRNPRIVRQHTIAAEFEGYEKLYLLGGSASWGNIRGMLTANIPGLKIHEEGSYPEPPDDVWGINDLALLEEADKVFAAEQKPFLAFIQLAGNHQPFTIPKDRRDFQLVDVDDKTLAKNGFDSLKSYNSIRFMSYALGNYFRVAKEHPYFKNTVWFLYGDHGNATTLDTPYKTVGLSDYHVGLSIYSPGNLAPRQVDDVVSSVDVLPTAAGLAGIPYTDDTFGRDMLDPRPASDRFAFFTSGIAPGVVDDEFVLSYDAAGKDRLYRYDSATPTKDLGEEEPARKREMEELTEALGNAAGWMLYHNAP